MMTLQHGRRRRLASKGKDLSYEGMVARVGALEAELKRLRAALSEIATDEEYRDLTAAEAKRVAQSALLYEDTVINQQHIIDGLRYELHVVAERARLDALEEAALRLEDDVPKGPQWPEGTWGPGMSFAKLIRKLKEKK